MWWEVSHSGCMLKVEPRRFAHQLDVGLHQSARVATKMYYKLGSLKQQKCVISEFWRLEVWNQGVGRAMFPLKPVGGNSSLPIPSFWWFASKQSLVILGLRLQPSIVTQCSLLMCLCLFSSSYKETSHIRLRAHPTAVWPHLSLIHYSCYDPVSK